MTKTSRILLLLVLVFQIILIPVSQAMAAQYSRNNEARSESPLEAVSSAFSGIVWHFTAKNSQIQVFVEGMTKHDSTKFFKKQCAREYGHKGHCDSCLCISITVTPAIKFPILQYTPTEHYRPLNYPLHTIFLAPPFRPPIA